MKCQQRMTYFLSQRKDPKAPGSPNGWNTAKRKAIQNKVPPNLQRGVIQYEGWEKDEKHIYHDYSKDSSTEEKRLFSLWGKRHRVEGRSTAAAMNDKNIIAALNVAAEHP